VALVASAKESLMPEIPISIYCRKSVNCDVEAYVVSNKGETTFQSEWLYAHLNCYDNAVSSEERRGREQGKTR
jgi:hypothetical protein